MMNDIVKEFEEGGNASLGIIESKDGCSIIFIIINRSYFLNSLLIKKHQDYFQYSCTTFSTRDSQIIVHSKSREKVVYAPKGLALFYFKSGTTHSRETPIAVGLDAVFE